MLSKSNWFWNIFLQSIIRLSMELFFLSLPFFPTIIKFLLWIEFLPSSYCYVISLRLEWLSSFLCWVFWWHWHTQKPFIRCNFCVLELAQVSGSFYSCHFLMRKKKLSASQNLCHSRSLFLVLILFKLLCLSNFFLITKFWIVQQNKKLLANKISSEKNTKT